MHDGERNDGFYTDIYNEVNDAIHLHLVDMATKLDGITERSTRITHDSGSLDLNINHIERLRRSVEHAMGELMQITSEVKVTLFYAVEDGLAQTIPFVFAITLSTDGRHHITTACVVPSYGLPRVNCDLAEANALAVLTVGRLF